MRVSLPTVAGHTVSRALAAIKLLVPRDLATLLQVTWYNDRHAPGPCPAPDKEWEMFCRTILALAGYQVDCLDLSTLKLTIMGDTSMATLVAGILQTDIYSQRGVFTWNSHNIMNY